MGQTSRQNFALQVILSGSGWGLLDPHVRMRRQVFRRIVAIWGREHEIKTDRTTQRLWIRVGQNAVVQTGGKQHQQPGPRRKVPVIGIERMSFSDGASMANSESGNKFIDPMRRLKAQHSLLA